MEIDQHLVWLLSAVKASISGNDVDEKKLNKSLSDCLGRIKSLYTNEHKEEDFEDFKAKFTLVMLLCCPAVREHSLVKGCNDFQPVIHTFPLLKESLFFSIVRNQKTYKFVSHLLSVLPPTTLQKLIKEYFSCTNDVTPVTLAITLELMKSFAINLQTSSLESINMEKRLEIMTQFFNFYSLKKVSSDSTVQVKLSAFYFMYLCECAFTVLCGCTGRHLELPDIYKSLLIWKNLMKIEVEKHPHNRDTLTLDIFQLFLQMCQENMQAISVDVWMAWSEVSLPSSVTVHRKSSTLQSTEKSESVQSVVCNIAFDILHIIKLQGDMDITLVTAGFKTVLEFFQQVAADPDYDPDVDLPVDQLLLEINLKDARYAKLMRILLKKDDVFTSEHCIDCICSHVDVVDNSSRFDLLVRMIKHIKEGKEYHSQSKELILNMAVSLSAEELLKVLDGHLDSGQDEMLKTQDFSKQMASVFNQLADSKSCKNSSKHIWLCLQSGHAVIQEAVRLTITFPGLVNVMVQALSIIPSVCQAKGNSGVSILVTVLQECLLTGLDGREQRDFVDLVKGLIKSEVLDLTEVLHLLVEPSMKIKSEMELENLDLPLELLKNIIDHDDEALMTPGPGLVSLILVLLSIIHSTATLHAVNCVFYMKLRTDSLMLLKCLIQSITQTPNKYEREISMLKQMIVKTYLHPRSIIPLQYLLECKQNFNSHGDCFLSSVFDLQHEQEKAGHLQSLQVIHSLGLQPKLKKASRQQWILMLLQLLPHCSEEEWLSAFYITHEYLNAGRMALHTMKVFQEVLYWMCIQTYEHKSVEESTLDESCTLTPAISLQHCFKCFSNASMVYLEELMQSVPYDKQFLVLCGISQWWCHVMPLYNHCQELPVFFLLRLCTAMEELFNSGNLVLEESRVIHQVNEASKKCGGKKGHKTNKKQNNSSVDVKDSQSVCNAGMGKNPTQFGKFSECSQNSFIANGVCKELSKESDTFETLSKTASNAFVSNSVDTSSFSEFSSVINVSEGENARTNNRGKLSKDDFKKKLEHLSKCFVKYVPSSNLASSVASKLKKLFERL